jgi:hypothetical protein
MATYKTMDLRMEIARVCLLACLISDSSGAFSGVSGMTVCVQHEN